MASPVVAVGVTEQIAIDQHHAAVFVIELRSVPDLLDRAAVGSDVQP